MSLIDVHAHALSREFLGELARQNAFGIEQRGDGFAFVGYGQLDPLLYQVEERLTKLAARDVVLQLISPPPRIVSHASWAADREFARELNRQTASLVAAGQGRFGGLAVPALADPEHAVAEISRALDEDGLVGVALPTSAAGRPLDDPMFEPLFAACAARACPVFMHPTTGVERQALGDFSMLQLVGWPSETSLCVARLIFAGVLERYAGLQLILAHGGGTLPFLAGRLDLAYDAPRYEANPRCRAGISRPPSSYLRNLFFDTVVAHPAALRFLIELVGADRVLFGSDDPFEIGDASGAHAMPVLAAQPADARDAILFGTARGILDHAKMAVVR